MIKAADTPSNLTANLRAAGKITLEFRGDLPLVTEKLEAMEHVKKVIHEGTDADGWHTLTVRAEAGTDTVKRPPGSWRNRAAPCATSTAILPLWKKYSWK